VSFLASRRRREGTSSFSKVGDSLVMMRKEATMMMMSQGDVVCTAEIYVCI
jgi:hypothetical protein